MSKKLITVGASEASAKQITRPKGATLFISAITIFALSAFSLWNAFALAQEMDTDSDGMPLSFTAANLCKNARKNYKQDIASERAKGLSLQLPPEETKYQIDLIKDYKKRVCFEAKYGYPPPLTSARQLCKEATKNYRMDVKNARAKGLSSSLSSEDLQTWIADEIKRIRQSKKQVCKEAKTETGPMP